MRQNTKKKTTKSWLKYLLLGGILAKFFVWLFNIKGWQNIVDNFGDFANKEKKELNKLTTEEETVSEFVAGSSSVFKDYFIPNYNNDHRPKILRSRSLLTIVAILLVIKIAVLSYIFWLYPNQARMSEELTNQIAQLTNQERLANDLKPYTLNSELSASALAKAKDMLEQDYFAHHSPDGRKPWDWINRDNYRYLLVGENLAMNFSTAGAAHKALMQSASHRQNILNPDYQDMGLAIVSGEYMGQEVNILVEIFAEEQTSTGFTADESPSTPKPEADLEEQLASEISVIPAREVGQIESLSPEPLDSQTAVEFQELTNQEEANQIEAKTETEDLVEKLSLSEEPRLAQVKLSPNLMLETTPNTDVTMVPVANNSQEGWLAKAIDWSKYLYLIVLAILIICLLINILVRISIQHKSVIIQTIVVIILISGLYLVRFHLVESLLSQVALI